MFGAANQKKFIGAAGLGVAQNPLLFWGACDDVAPFVCCGGVQQMSFLWPLCKARYLLAARLCFICWRYRVGELSVRRLKKR